jgi:chitin disaccharide deacetylase
VPPRLIVCADDFGLDEAVNAAVEAAHRDGILTCASLMVGAPAAADAVARAKRLPGLRVGLHLVLTDGTSMLPPERIPALVDARGRFDDGMARAGVRFFFSPAARRQLALEIRAQFAAFAATGLALDHANAHRHFHLHPTIAALMIGIGREFGLQAVRVPAEPGGVLLAPLAALQRRRLRRAGLAVNDRLYGIAWTGGMDEARVLEILGRLPAGVSEIYSHPAVAQTPALRRAMPDYRPVAELAALLSPRVRDRVAERGIRLISYGDLAA